MWFDESVPLPSVSQNSQELFCQKPPFRCWKLLLFIITDNVHHFCPSCLKTLSQFPWYKASMLICDLSVTEQVFYLQATSQHLNCLLLTESFLSNLQFLFKQYFTCFCFLLIFVMSTRAHFLKEACKTLLFTLKIKVSVVLQITIIIIKTES